MPFPRQSATTPAAIGEIEIRLFDPTGTPADRTGRAHIEVKDAAGVRIRILVVDLLPHLTTAQRNTISSLMTAIRNQAVTEIIP